MVHVKISETIANEYMTRCPVDIRIREAGVHQVSRDEAREIMLDAEFNCDPRCIDIGAYGVPLGTANAYRALAKQVRRTLLGGEK